MKRTNENVVGQPKLRELRPDVAGVGSTPTVIEVASYRHGLDDPMGTAQDDAALLAEFADFMNAEDELDNGSLRPPDPGFRERLRRRLWRTHVMTSLRDGRGPH